MSEQPRIYDGRMVDQYLAKHLLGWKQSGDKWIDSVGKAGDCPMPTMFMQDIWDLIEPAMLVMGYMLFIDREPASELHGTPAYFSVGWAHVDNDAICERAESALWIPKALSAAACKAVGPDRCVSKYDPNNRPF